MTTTRPVAIVAADGSLLIMRIIERGEPVTATQVELEIAKASEAWAECSPELLPLSGWRFVEAADIPTDRSYRSAWKDTGAAITHDMGKAREIHRNKLRAERAPLLAALDVEYQRADETSDAPGKAKIAGRKQRLRDVTADPRIDKAKTISELAAVKIDARVLDW